MENLKDLDVRAGKTILKNAPLRKSEDEAQIFYDGEWFDLCRTDLLDDVMTSDEDVLDDSLEDIRRFYLDKIMYGVRVGVLSSGVRVFAAIDSESDD